MERTFHGHVACGGEYARGGIIELSGGKRVASSIDTRRASGDQDFAVWKQCGRMAVARCGHAASRRKCPSDRIVEFGASLGAGRRRIRTITSSDEDPTVQEQGRCVKESRCDLTAGSGECA